MPLFCLIIIWSHVLATRKQFRGREKKDPFFPLPLRRRRCTNASLSLSCTARKEEGETMKKTRFAFRASA